MSIVHVEKNCKDKAAAIRRFSAQADVPLSQICFMGDDVNDLGAIQLAGFAAAPADARPAVLKAVSFVATKNGGQGAVRELVDFLLAENISKHTPKLEPNLS
jgi:3-deoxy-D-manno-octulosonate 8-phosphate phosphatase KdsC-like HAD superfamily phosphatase